MYTLKSINFRRLEEGEALKKEREEALKSVVVTLRKRKTRP